MMKDKNLKVNSSSPDDPSGGAPEPEAASNFIRIIINEDNKTGKFGGKVHTRFPPEPNGFLHIGHAKSICLNFGLAEEFGGKCGLRFDDTNPEKEGDVYGKSIIEDVRWLGFNWEDRQFYASDYFEQLYLFAVKLIEDSKAYVDDLSADEIREYRGTLTEPGKESPCRNRSVEENLDLFERMKKGEFADGAKVLRAKIDMASGNLNLRDPVLYRIIKAKHHRTGDKWCIYPMYDFAPGQSDSIEGVTHSICTLEFEDHRPLYDWLLDQLDIYHPRQIEFARLNLTYAVLSKRQLLQLVESGHVSGWDAPHMPTISGLRRRGFTPESIRDFCDRIGVAKANSTVEMALLEHCLREDLNKQTLRRMAVIQPLKIILINYPEDQVEEFDAENNPEDPSAGHRKIPFSREIYVERDDFMEDPLKKFFRLAPGREVRLKHAYIIKCEKVVMDEAEGRVKELHCSYDPESKSGGPTSGRKIKGTLHWVSAKHSVSAEVRLYEKMFTKENPGDVKADSNIKWGLNPDSLKTYIDCKMEPALKETKPGDRFQFLRMGYFCTDPDSQSHYPVFNRAVTLRDTWGKIMKKSGGN